MKHNRCRKKFKHPKSEIYIYECPAGCEKTLFIKQTIKADLIWSQGGIKEKDFYLESTVRCEKCLAIAIRV